MTRRLDPAEQATRLLAAHGVSTPPVTLLDIAQGLGFTVVGHAAAHLSEAGFVYADRANKIIGVNTAASPARRRFALAHLLGHDVLHPQRVLTVCQRLYTGLTGHDCIASRAQEQQATQFAFDLLMPAPMLTDHVAALAAADTGAHGERSAQLAATFQVSGEAMHARLAVLALVLP